MPTAGQIISTIVGVLLVLMSAVGGGYGFALLIATPYGPTLSYFVGGSLILAAAVAWGASCFVRRIFERKA